MSEEQVKNEEAEVEVEEVVIDPKEAARLASQAKADIEAAAEEAAAEAKRNEEKVVCYLSKESVPMSDTVEVQYNEEGLFRVQSHLVRY